MKILNRYILREHVGPLLFALTALTSLLLLNYIAKQFSRLVGKGLPWSVIGEFFLLSIPFTVAMTIPMAVLVSTLYAFSRLAAENEVTAFKASGVSVRRLLAPVLLAAVGVAVVMIYFNDQILPAANHRLSILQSDIFRKKPTLALRPQVINRVNDRLSIRADRIEAGDQMRNVVIYDFSAPDRPRTVYADSGTLAMTTDMRNLEMVLFDGVVHEFPREEPTRLQRTAFVQNRVVVPDVGNTLERTDAAGTQVKGDREMTVCEMQAQYDSAARAYEATYDRLDSLAVEAERQGHEVDIPDRRTTYRENGLGALYCRLLDRLGVQTAYAAAAAAPPLSAPGARPSATATAESREPGAERRALHGLQDTVPLSQPDSLSAALDADAAARAAERRTMMPSAGSGIEAVISVLQMDANLNRDRLNTYDVEIHKKFALAVACVVFVLLGAPIALRFPRGGVGLVIGVSLGVFALYYVALIAGETVANKGYLPPFAAMWAANLLFGAVGLALLVRMGNEGATSRGGDMGELLGELRMRLARAARRVGLPAERRRVS